MFFEDLFRDSDLFSYRRSALRYICALTAVVKTFDSPPLSNILPHLLLEL